MLIENKISQNCVTLYYFSFDTNKTFHFFQFIYESIFYTRGKTNISEKIARLNDKLSNNLLNTKSVFPKFMNTIKLCLRRFNSSVPFKPLSLSKLDGYSF